MQAVVAVMLIAVCEPDLVHCQPLETWPHAWETVEACNSEKAGITGRIQEHHGRGKTVMGKCRLYLDEDQIFNRPSVAKTDPTSPGLIF